MRLLALFTLAFALNVHASYAQFTSVGCDSMALVVNVGSQETALSLYHPGGYLTWPPSENVMDWSFIYDDGSVEKRYFLR